MSRPTPPPAAALDQRMQALEDAADAAMLAPSAHGSQPWTIVLHRDRLELGGDRSRQLRALDPPGRELVQSLGAALLNVRVVLAARGWAVAVDRFPDPAAPDLAAVVRPVLGAPEPGLPRLAAVVPQRRTNRRGFLAEEVPDELLGYLRAAAAAEDTDLVPVLSDDHRRLVSRLTLEADAVQADDPACRADRLRWRSPPGPEDSQEHLTVDDDSGADRTFVVLATRTDDPPAWLRSGEALERVLLELSRLGWSASPMSQVLEVPGTRAELRAGLTGERHPQMLLRIGFADASPRTARRPRQDVVHNSVRPLDVPPPRAAPGLTRGGTPARPVSDGRGGTTWT
jgi:nitroreductase